MKIETDRRLGCNVLSAEDMTTEKLHCLVDRIEPTDVYDLCRLMEFYISKMIKDVAIHATAD